MSSTASTSPTPPALMEKGRATHRNSWFPSDAGDALHALEAQGPWGARDTLDTTGAIGSLDAFGAWFPSTARLQEKQEAVRTGPRSGARSCHRGVLPWRAQIWAAHHRLTCWLATRGGQEAYRLLGFVVGSSAKHSPRLFVQRGHWDPVRREGMCFNDSCLIASWRGSGSYTNQAPYYRG
jgi:hypothetical protein